MIFNKASIDFFERHVRRYLQKDVPEHPAGEQVTKETIEDYEPLRVNLGNKSVVIVDELVFQELVKSYMRQHELTGQKIVQPIVLRVET